MVTQNLTNTPDVRKLLISIYESNFVQIVSIIKCFIALGGGRFLEEGDRDRGCLKRPSSEYHDQYPGDHKRTSLSNERYTERSGFDYRPGYERSVHHSYDENRSHYEDLRRTAPVTSQYEHESDRYRTNRYYDEYSYSSTRDREGTSGYERNAYYRDPQRDYIRTDDTRKNSDASLYNRDFYRDHYDRDSLTRVADYENYYGSQTASVSPHSHVVYGTQASPVSDAYDARRSTYSSATHNFYDRDNYSQQEYPGSGQHTSAMDSYTHATSPPVSYSPDPRYPQEYLSYYQYPQGERSSYDAAAAQSYSHTMDAHYPGRISATRQRIAFDRTRYKNN